MISKISNSYGLNMFSSVPGGRRQQATGGRKDGPERAGRVA